MNSSFENRVRNINDLSPLVAKKGYWNRANQKGELISNMGFIPFSLATNTLLIKHRNSIKDNAKMIQQDCDLEIEDIEERLSNLVEQKILEFEVDAKRRGHELESYL